MLSAISFHPTLCTSMKQTATNLSVSALPETSNLGYSGGDCPATAFLRHPHCAASEGAFYRLPKCNSLWELLCRQTTQGLHETISAGLCARQLQCCASGGRGCARQPVPLLRWVVAGQETGRRFTTTMLTCLKSSWRPLSIGQPVRCVNMALLWM